MKAVLALTLLVVLAAMVQHSEGFVFKNLGRKIRDGVRGVGTSIRDGVRGVGTGIRDGVRGVGTSIRDGVRNVGKGLRDAVRPVSGRLRDRVRQAVRGLNLFRGKRSALTLNRLDDVNAVDLATTFNLDLPAVREMFLISDLNKDGSLDGQEVLVFVGMIEGLMNLNDQQPVVMKQ